jgi:hypothetical protein
VLEPDAAQSLPFQLTIEPCLKKPSQRRSTKRTQRASSGDDRANRHNTDNALKMFLLKYKV